jgi:hypothetical protein
VRLARRKEIDVDTGSEGSKRPGLRKRFWIECIAFAIASALAVLTLVRRDWIEAIFGVNPDAHSGALEVAITVVAGAVALAIGAMARAEFRRARPARGALPRSVGFGRR